MATVDQVDDGDGREDAAESLPSSTRRSPAVARAATILQLLAPLRDGGATLSEVARWASLSKATTHSLLASLLDVGFVVRSSDRRYRLGLAVTALGEAALVGRELAARTRRTMFAIADELERHAVLSCVVGREIVIVSTTRDDAQASTSIRAGRRIPLIPPLGSVFLAWATDDQVREWLSADGMDASGVDVSRYEHELVLIRERGFAVGVDADPMTRISDVVQAADESVDADELRERLDAAVAAERRGDHYFADLDRPGPYAVSNIAVPIFDDERSTAFAVSLTDFDVELSSLEIVQLGERLRAAFVC